MKKPCCWRLRTLLKVYCPVNEWRFLTLQSSPQRVDRCPQSLRVETAEIIVEISRRKSLVSLLKRRNQKKCHLFDHILSQAVCLWLCVLSIFHFLPLKNLLIASIWQTSGSSVGALATLSVHFIVFGNKHLTVHILGFSSAQPLCCICLATFDPVQNCHPNPSMVIWS